MSTRGHDAPGLLAATEFQFMRALAWLVDVPPDCCVGLETGDDLAIRGSISARGQAKNTLNTRPPFTDRSVALWKTLDIWTSERRAGRLQDSTRLVLVTNRLVPTESLAARIARASDESAVGDCIKALRKISQSPSKTISRHAERVAADWNDVTWVIERIALADASSPGVKEIGVYLADRLHFPPDVDAETICDSLSGWIHRCATQSWLDGKPAWIPRKALDTAYHKTLRLLLRRRSSERPVWEIPIAAGAYEEARSKVFFDQLLAVELDDETLSAAIADYLRFRAERLRLTEAGEITEPDWQAFFSSLQERWRRIRRTCDRARAREISDCHHGLEVYSKTVEVGFRESLAGTPTEHEYLTSGGYHRLADKLDVTWHPRYPHLRSESL